MQAMSPCNRRVRPHGLLCQLLAVLVVTLGLLNLSGCAGGFQGYSPVGPTVSDRRVSLFLSARPQRSVSPPQEPAPLSYQWFKNGVAIDGATSSSYTTPPTVAGDTGSLFTVTVTNSAGSVTSLPGTLTVQLPLRRWRGALFRVRQLLLITHPYFWFPLFPAARPSSVPQASAVPTSPIPRLAAVPIRRLS